jgi:hypothetical protein
MEGYMSILPSRLSNSEGGYSWYPASYNDIKRTMWRDLLDFQNSDQQLFLIKNSIGEVLGCVTCHQAPYNLLLANTFLSKKANPDKVAEVLKLLLIDYFGSKYEEERISNKYLIHQIQNDLVLREILQKTGFKEVEDRYVFPLSNILNCPIGSNFFFHTLNGHSSFELEGMERMERQPFSSTICRQNAVTYAYI